MAWERREITDRMESQGMKTNVILFVRGILILALLTAGWFALELFWEMASGDFSIRGLFAIDREEARSLLSFLNVKLNQAIAVAFIAVGIAVPLTANMYSVKFLDFFIKNPIHASALVFVVLSNIIGTWAAYIVRNSTAPSLHVHLVFVLTVACLLLLFPYLAYVFRFLHPNTLLNLLDEEVRGNLRQARSASKAADCRGRVAESLEHIANIAIRSIDRADRNTAIAGALVLDRIARHYGKQKRKLSARWFQAEEAFFLGFSAQAVEEVSATRSWLEMKLYSQMLEILRAASPRMPELTSTIASSIRELGLEPATLQDPNLRAMAMEFFNTFLRLTINRRDVRSVFILFDQYRKLAEALLQSYPEQVLEIADYFQYYGQAARDQQLSFVVETVAYDLAQLVQKAWEMGASNRRELLERFLRYGMDGQTVLPGIRKAQALLASYFLLSGRPEPAEVIRAGFREMEAATIQNLKEALLRVTRPKYWEISERRMNIDYVPEAQRQKLKEFFESLEMAKKKA
jgi:hypothetical protein